MHRVLRAAAAAVASALIVAVTENAPSACTAFCAAAKDGTVLVGNNEDWFNPRTKIHFIPAAPGTYGRLYVGFDDLYPQGGMNERGLWFDGFATPPVRPDTTRPSYEAASSTTRWRSARRWRRSCSVSQSNRAFLKEAVLMFADASGDAASIEANAIVRKKAPHFVQTNFRQSRRSARPDERFTIATSMLDHASDVSVELFRDILAATHQEGPAPTQYSNLYDLRSRTMYLYFFHDYSRGVTIRLDEELKKGERVVDIPSLFPPNPAAEQFAATSRRQHGALSPAPVLIGTLVAAVVALDNMQIGWGADRTATLTAELRDRFGLELIGARRTMDTLIVDDIRPETSLVLLGHIGRASEKAPAPVRQQLARLFAVH